MAIPRMKLLAEDEANRVNKTGKEFLLGLDEHGEPARTVSWHGTHHNIYDESIQNSEMQELLQHLSK
jgi:hypothetical protein